MVPRVFKTNVGDIFTTNTVNETELALGDRLAPGADGILVKAADDAAMKWQVVKVYTMPDHQKGVKIMRIA
jgi:3-dehydroquinate synthase class II